MISQCAIDPTLELEARLGRVVQGRFCPGVTRSHMDKLVKSLVTLCASDPTSLTAVHDTWREEENYYFEHAGVRMRTRVDFVDDKSFGIHSQTIQKTVIDSLLLKTHTVDVRIALARETKVRDPPPIVDTTHVRVKQVRRFRVERSPVWIDCTMQWNGTTRTDAERQQMTSDPCFEIECELRNTDVAAWMARHGGKGHKVARSFLFKVADIMMLTGVHFHED